MKKTVKIMATSSLIGILLTAFQYNYFNRERKRLSEELKKSHYLNSEYSEKIKELEAKNILNLCIINGGELQKCLERLEKE